MCHDERRYHSPHEFNPDRFLGSKLAGHGSEENKKCDPATDKPSELIFGFGRRVCPGEHLARTIIWILVANTLALFDVDRHTGTRKGRKFFQSRGSCLDSYSMSPELCIFTIPLVLMTNKDTQNRFCVLLYLGRARWSGQEVLVYN